ncbi:MAG: PRC-barrel domain-containing protein [Chloroflexota bacterium]|nr:PRC-barrel domain-containing protein [Chloroflexota bacterium]
MRLKELRGLPVIDPTAARKIGSVVDYQVDPTSGRLAAVDITSPAPGEGQRVLASRIRRAGRSAVILTPHGGSIAATTPEVDERWLDGSTLAGLEVMGDDGNRIGRLLDATFDQDSLVIDAYLLRVSLWQRLTRSRGRIEPATVHSCSRELMMVGSGHLLEANQPAAAVNESSTLITRMPLKTEDRVSAPAFEQAPDGQTVSARPN